MVELRYRLQTQTRRPELNELAIAVQQAILRLAAMSADRVAQLALNRQIRKTMGSSESPTDLRPV